VTKAIELKPDIIILDLAMPRMDALSAAREIGKALPGLPIALYSLHGFDSLELEAKKVGIRRVVLKPNSDGLFRAIEELLKDVSHNAVQEKTLSAAASAGPIGVTPPAQSEATATEKTKDETPTKEN
jgi:DNA-binding NarL/FixJ family response regulator